MDKILFYMAERFSQRQPMELHMTWLALWGDPGHKRPEMCHRWGYTKLQLVEALKAVGFVNVTVEKPRYHFAQRDMRVEATKPEAA